MNYTAEIYSNINPALFYGGGFCGGVDPRREQYAGEDVAGVEVPNYKTKYEALQNVIKDNYQLFEVDYYGVDNDNYVDGEGFCCEPKAQAKNARSLPTENVDYEKLQYYYHSDHLGSASYITNLDGEVVQHVEYVPFGEVFLEERNNTWNTPFLFNGKELDEETGLYYYGARYYNPRISLWYGVDPLAERTSNFSPYAYTYNNPIIYTDPEGEIGLIGAAIGAVVGAAAEFGGQVIGNLVQGKPAFQEIDWADVVISAGVGAAAGATGGASLLVTQIGTEALKASVDWTNERGLETVMGIVGKEKELNRVGVDFLGGVIGMGVTRALPLGKIAARSTANQFAGKGIIGMSELVKRWGSIQAAEEFTNAIIGGAASGLFKGGVDYLETKGKNKNGYHNLLPEVIVYGDRGEYNPKKKKTTPKGEVKIHRHIIRSIKGKL